VNFSLRELFADQNADTVRQVAFHLVNMLGARARAAEYNAFKAASARQASQKAEGEPLPLQPVAVSLGAFTKHTQPSRNKGPKAWIPLVLEDAPDEDTPHSEDHSPSRGTPLQHTREPLQHSDVPDGDPATMTDPDASPQAHNVEKLQGHIPKVFIPTAPKAILTDHERRPPTSANPKIPRGLDSVISQSQQEAVPLSFDGSWNRLQRGSGHPYADMLWPSSIAHVSGLGQFQGPGQHSLSHFDGTTVPAVDSSVHQEHKLAMQAHIYGSTSNSVVDSPLPFSPWPSPDSVLSSFPDTPDANHLFAWEQDSPISETIHQPMHPPEGQHYHFTTRLFAGENLHSLPVSANLDRRRSLSGGRSNHFSWTRLDQSAGHSTREEQVNPITQPDKNGEPYDRKNRMQHVVVAQQALTSRGETVFHNPERQEAKEEKAAGAIEREDHWGIERVGLQKKDLSPEELDAVVRAIHQPPPELEQRKGHLKAAKAEKTGRDGDVSLRERFNVGSADWFELKAVTYKERDRMLDAVREVMAMQTHDMKNRLVAQDKPDRSSRLTPWLGTDPRGQSSVRVRIEQIAADYATNAGFSNAANREHGMSSNGVDVRAGTVRVVGNVLANLADDMEQTKGVVGQKTTFANRSRHGICD